MDIPTIVEALKDFNIVTAAVGKGHTLFVTGIHYAWLIWVKQNFVHIMKGKKTYAYCSQITLYDHLGCDVIICKNHKLVFWGLEAELLLGCVFRGIAH